MARRVPTWAHSDQGVSMTAFSHFGICVADHDRDWRVSTADAADAPGVR